MTRHQIQLPVLKTPAAARAPPSYYAGQEKHYTADYMTDKYGRKTLAQSK